MQKDWNTQKKMHLIQLNQEHVVGKQFAFIYKFIVDHCSICCTWICYITYINLLLLFIKSHLKAGGQTRWYISSMRFVKCSTGAWRYYTQIIIDCMHHCLLSNCFIKKWRCIFYPFKCILAQMLPSYQLHNSDTTDVRQFKKYFFYYHYTLT